MRSVDAGAFLAQRHRQSTFVALKLDVEGLNPGVPAPASGASDRMRVVVMLERARGLMAGDSNGFSDPYVRLALAGEKRKSRVIKKTLDPEWGQRFEWVGERGKLLGGALVLEVMDCASPAD